MKTSMPFARASSHDVADRQDLPGEVGDVGELDDPGPGRDRLADPVDEVLRVDGERDREGDRS